MRIFCLNIPEHTKLGSKDQQIQKKKKITTVWVTFSDYNEIKLEINNKKIILKFTHLENLKHTSKDW